MVRMAVIDRACMNNTVQSKCVGEDAFVIELCTEANQTVRNTVASLNFTVTKEIRAPSTDVGEISPNAVVQNAVTNDTKTTAAKVVLMTTKDVVMSKAEQGASFNDVKVMSRIKA